jgi:hypothetical protein
MFLHKLWLWGGGGGEGLVGFPPGSANFDHFLFLA